MNIFFRRQTEAAAFAIPFIGAALMSLLGMLLFPQQTWAQERELEFAINKAGILILNGKLPETPIHLSEGDRVIVRFKNNTASKLGIRWHGVYRMEAQGSDGVPETPRRFYLIQRAIKAGKTFTYRWKVEEPGTFWYHCHLDGNEHVRVYGAKKTLPAVPIISAKREKPTALARK